MGNIIIGLMFILVNIFLSSPNTLWFTVYACTAGGIILGLGIAEHIIKGKR